MNSFRLTCSHPAGLAFLCLALATCCCCLLGAKAEGAREPELAVTPSREWRVCEFAFSAGETLKHPLSVQLTATFRGPGGVQYRVPGFWDGGNLWKVRFMPDRPGRWTYETEASQGEAVWQETLFDSGVRRGGDPAHRVDLDLRGVQELCLWVDDAGDGIDYDHADWAEARLASATGTVVYLDALTPARADQGYGKLGRGRNVSGAPLKIGDRTFAHGLGTHAPGEIVYRLPKSTVRFQAWVGVDAEVGKHGSVRFRVTTRRVDKEHVGRRIPGLDGRRGSFTALPATGTNRLFRHGGILRVSADHRYLTYTDGAPFFWLGDTWWFCPSDLLPIDGSSNPKIPSAYKLCVATRQRQGFSVIHMDFLDRIDGQSAFADFHRDWTIHAPFWRTVDRYLAVANAADLIPVVGMGWVGRPLSLEEWKVVWGYVVARYGACGVTWLICGEYNVRGAKEERIAATLAVGRYVKSIDPWKRAMTIHPWYYLGDKRQAWKESWYDFIMLQGGHGAAPPVDVYLDARRSRPTRPVVEGECAYEGIGTFTAADVRNRAWRAFLSGCCGYTYGSHGLWYPAQDEHDTRTKEWGKPTPWWIALKRPGAEQLGRMRGFYERSPWWRLQPRPGAVSLVGREAAEEVKTVVDFFDGFQAAKAEHALWCKPVTHPGVRNEPPEIELHPREGPAATLTWPRQPLPNVETGEALRLVLALGMDPGANLSDPKHPADGVTYAVVVNGETVLRRHRKSKQWEYHSFDVTKFAGRQVTLRLETDMGKNSFWDHARFRAPVIVRVDAKQREPLRELYSASLPEPVLVAGEGTRTFVVYFPGQPGSHRPGLRLHGVTANATYSALWFDPRSGAETSLPPVHSDADGRSLLLPRPPDDRDWVLLLTAAGRG